MLSFYVVSISSKCLINFHSSCRMWDFLAIFLRLSEHLQFHIWILLINTYSLSMENHFTFVEEDGTTQPLATRYLGPFGPIHLGQQIANVYWGHQGTTFSKLMRAYTQGRLIFQGTTLKIDLHCLFSLIHFT